VSHGSITPWTADSYIINYHSLDEVDVENLNANDEITTGKAFNSRTIFIIGPKLGSSHHIRMILQYPAIVGFNTVDVLRAVDALQVSDSARFGHPSS
jgi:alkyl hydroperoxide reductase subunit AhpC